ncbi:S41 family peptidase [Kutzneria kofuensis]|uniref:C-terminal processing protease CtpA/Prc n=1 Tax=Kutzneria kofuensis TaxID=103725 RepID=A0A7W9KBL4_9PSEU|nr:S41 family peptidase [Kutzneria kofuensis]MBB5889618.1 C-terminal processing protease CtpA/Prc [Kutzneria kofuensis]
MTTRRELIDAAIPLITDNYVFPDVAEKIVDVLRRNDYDHLADVDAFAAAVTADLQSVNGDKHLRLLHEEPKPRAVSDAHGFDRVEVLDGNIGYVENTRLRDPRAYGDIAAAAMTLVADTDALIIDLRRCRGGDPGMVSLVCGYLFDESKHVNDIYSRPDDMVVQFWTPPYVPGRRFGGAKPVWVLTSSFTFSGGEELAYDLQQTGWAVIVGETTRGGAHPTDWHEIAEHLYLTVPEARAINPKSGTNWEAVGVAPDIDVPAADALDHALELARNFLAEQGN